MLVKQDQRMPLELDAGILRAFGADHLQKKLANSSMAIMGL